MTTREPGASDVFTCGLIDRPFSTAFFARRPAASITLGFEVFVHEVMAAISTSPEPMSVGCGFAGATRSGVGRLFTISTTSRGAPLGVCWLASLIAPRPVLSVTWKRRASSSGFFEKPFSAGGLLKSDVN